MKKEKIKDTGDCRSYLVRLLTGRAYTEREIEQKLLQRKCDPDEVRELISEFRTLGLIDDEAYARLFAEGHESWGNDRIRFELHRRGVDDETIASVLENDERERAYPLAEIWSEQGIEWHKIAARLMRRGFSARTIRALEKDRMARQAFAED